MTGPHASHDAGLADARRIADAVLYEGYVLFPYHASAHKNRYRWQFGVVVPEAQARAGSSEPCELRSQCLLRTTPAARVEVIVRFLGVRRRQVEVAAGDGGHRPVEQLDAGGNLLTSWDEGVEHEMSTGPLRVDRLLAGGHAVDLSVTGSWEVDQLAASQASPRGRVVRTVEPVDAVAEVWAEALADDVVRLSTVVCNRTTWAAPEAPRDLVMRRSLAGVHLLLVARSASFASLIDPQPWAAPWAAHVTNRHTFPVLVGPPGRDDLVLSAPIILSDHPELAPESTGDAFDATEIDELLTLSVRAMTAEEKRQARATDRRAAEVIDRAEGLPPEMIERLHGAIRQFDPPDRRGEVEQELKEFLGVDEPPTEEVVVDGTVLALGDQVRLRPSRRADAQDLFAAGRLATVKRIERDLEGAVYIAVTLDQDPASEAHEWARRFLYFHPEEVEPVRPTGETVRRHGGGW